MKVGTENKKTLAAAVILMLIAIPLVIRVFWATRPGTTAPAAQSPVTSAQANLDAALNPNTGGNAARQRGRDPRAHYVGVVITPSLDPRLRLDLLKDSEDVKYEGSGRNIFREHLEDIPKPEEKGLLTGKKQPPAPPVPPGPPPPPPINVKFFGWASKPGEPKAIFLTQGDTVFVAHEGDIIARRYKVVKISNNAVEIEDVLSNNRQSIPLTQG